MRGSFDSIGNVHVYVYCFNKYVPACIDAGALSAVRLSHPPRTERSNAVSPTVRGRLCRFADNVDVLLCVCGDGDGLLLVRVGAARRSGMRRGASPTSGADADSDDDSDEDEEVCCNGVCVESDKRS